MTFKKKIQHWLPVWTKVKVGSPFCKYFLTINNLYNGATIVNLPLAVEEIWFFKILDLDFRFGQEVKVKLGSLFNKYFLTDNDLYNGGKIVNLPIVVVEIWYVLYVKLSLPVWTGSNSQIGVTFCKYVLTINDLYNGRKIVNLPLVVVEIWFVLNVKLSLLVWTESKGQIGGHFCINIFWQPTICTMVERLWIYLLWLLRYDLFYMLYFYFRFGQKVKVKLGSPFDN